MNSKNMLLIEDGSEEALNELLVLNEGLMYAQLKKFGYLKDEGALSVAYEALWRAAITYKMDSGTRFSTYATVVIYNALGSYGRKQMSELETVSYHNFEGCDLMDLLDSSPAYETEVVERDTLHATVQAINAAKGKFRGKKLSILNEWFRTEFKATNVEVAQEVGCASSYVSMAINEYREVLAQEMEMRNRR